MLVPSGLSCGVSSCITGADLHQLGWATATPALEAALCSQAAFLPTLPKSRCPIAQGPAEGPVPPQGPAQLRRSQGCAAAGGPPQGAIAASPLRLASPNQPQIGPDQQHPACQLAGSPGGVTVPFAENSSQPPAGTDTACPPGWQAGPAALHTQSQGKECPDRLCMQHPEMPRWLPEACSRLSHRLRAAASSSSTVGAYIGQQVAFVLLDDVIAVSLLACCACPCCQTWLCVAWGTCALQRRGAACCLDRSAAVALSQALIMGTGHCRKHFCSGRCAAPVLWLADQQVLQKAL